MRVEQAEVPGQDVDRQRQHDGADEAVGDEPEPEVRLAAEVVAGEREGGRRAEQHRQAGAEDGDDQRIDDGVHHLLVGEDLGVIGRASG